MFGFFSTTVIQKQSENRPTMEGDNMCHQSCKCLVSLVQWVSKREKRKEPKHDNKFNQVQVLFFVDGVLLKLKTK